MSSNEGREHVKKASRNIGRAAGRFMLSVLAAGDASAAVPAAARRLEGISLPPITGSEKSGVPSKTVEDMTSAKEKWVQQTFEDSLKGDYAKAAASLIERTDPLGEKWSFFKVMFRENGQTNLIGCAQSSNVCINLKLPLDPDDVNPKHRGFWTRRQRARSFYLTYTNPARIRRAAAPG